MERKDFWYWMFRRMLKNTPEGEANRRVRQFWPWPQWEPTGAAPMPASYVMGPRGA